MSNTQVVLDEALSQAVMQDNVQAAADALAQGADANGWIPVHQHMLLAAAVNGSYDMVDLLLKYDANPLATDRDGANIYHKLAEGMPLQDAERARIVRRLKDVGPDPDDAVEKWQATPLQVAAIHGMSDVCHALVADCGADVDAYSPQRGTAGHLAIERKHPETLYTLLLLGTDAKAANPVGLDFAEAALEKNHKPSIEALAHFEALAEVDPQQENLHAVLTQPDAKGKTLLGNPKTWQKAEQVLATLDKQGTPLSRKELCAGGWDSPLHLAYRCGKLAPVLEHTLAHDGAVTTADLRGESGGVSVFCHMLAEAGLIGKVFAHPAQGDNTPDNLRQMYHALPEAAKAQVPNFHQLLCRSQMQHQSQKGR